MENNSEGTKNVTWGDNFTRICGRVHISSEASCFGVLYRRCDVWGDSDVETFGKNIK